MNNDKTVKLSVVKTEEVVRPDYSSELSAWRASVISEMEETETKTGVVMKTLILVASVVMMVGCGQGPTGATGAQGQQGNPGTPASDITTVQFCPGAGSYPSTFPEVGFCINNNIYAVYSANDGFLTELPAGQYNSNAVGSSCNFTILPNCYVQANP